MGEGDPQEAKRWIKHMENFFRLDECLEAYKVVYATNQFRDYSIHFRKNPQDLWRWNEIIHFTLEP